jgi:superfamily II DNA helicase RecQ
MSNTASLESPPLATTISILATVEQVRVLSLHGGLHLACAILRNLLGFNPHDYHLEGVCKILHGTNVLAIIPTGGGKTGYFFMAMLLLRAI